jgi:ATP-binding cassette subfamily F protein 3
VCHAGRQEIFLGSYEEFLETVGWEEEGPPPKAKSKSASSEQKGKSGSSEHTKVLKTLENEVFRLEKTLLEMEGEQSKDQLLLAEASAKGDRQKIQEIHKKTSAREKEIAEQYEKLIKLSEELDKKKKNS